MAIEPADLTGWGPSTPTGGLCERFRVTRPPVLSIVVLLLSIAFPLPGCFSTGGKEPDPQETALLAAGQLELVGTDLDAIGAAFPDDPKATLIITSAKLVVTTIAAQAKAYGNGDSTGAKFETAIAAAHAALDQIIAQDVGNKARGEKIRVALLVAQLVLHHALPLVQAGRVK